MPTSHFTMDCKVVSWTPLASLLTKWVAEALAVHSDDFAGQKLLHLLLIRPLRGGPHLRVEVEDKIAELPNDAAPVARTVRIFIRYSVRSRPARSRRKITRGRAKPS